MLCFGKLLTTDFKVTGMYALDTCHHQLCLSTSEVKSTQISFAGYQIQMLLVSYAANFVLFIVIIGIKHGTRVTQVKRRKTSRSNLKKKSSSKLNVEAGEDAALLEALKVEEQASDLSQTMSRE